MRTKVIFITGTDTGVGKTLLTALLLSHLTAGGARVCALKPFCSGGRADAELLHELQNDVLTLDEINPFYFPEPIAPLISARKHKRRIELEQVVQHVNSIAARIVASSASRRRPSADKSKPKIQNYILIEGSGGLLVPLGDGYTVRDLIVRLACDVLVVARNQLGTINHTLLTIQALVTATLDLPFSTLSSARTLGAQHSTLRTPHSALKVLLMGPFVPDQSSHTNPQILSELLSPVPVLRLPFLGRNCKSLSALKKTAEKFNKTLAQLIQ